MLLGVCGLIGTDDLLACFCAGAFMNWDGVYLEETLARHDEVNSSLDYILNLIGFGWIGVVMPYSSFNDPKLGLSLKWLLLLSVLVLCFRRVPALLAVYKFIPATETWKDALFMG